MTNIRPAPNHFEAQLFAAIARSNDKTAEKIPSKLKSKLYSKAQLCRDEAYKTPGFAQAVISAGEDYGAFVELHEDNYLAICKQYAYCSNKLEPIQLASSDTEDTQLPVIARIQDCVRNTAAENSFKIEQFSNDIDFKAAGEVIKAYTDNLFIYENDSGK
jgi:hypothetical protein